MHKKFLPYLIDPVTKEALKLEITESRGDKVLTGFLLSSTSRFPIVNGIPRFAGYTTENYAESFGYQWNKWSRIQFESDNVGSPMYGHTTNMWEKITGIKSEIKGQLVLDLGCGPGRFVEVAKEKGAMVIGLDYSMAVEAAAKNFKDDDNVCIIQGDALNLPICDAVVDGVFSIGVLHHTSNPEQGVKETARILKKGGWFGLAVYSKGGYYDFPSVQFWRKIFKFLWPVLKHYPPLAYTYLTVYGLRPLKYMPFLDKVIRRVLPTVNSPDIRWALLDTFDSVTPSYQSAHEPFEVFQWFKKSGFVNIEPSDWGFTSFHGKKEADHAGNVTDQTNKNEAR